MMDGLEQLTFTVLPAYDLSAAQKTDLIRLCTTAYEENFDNMFEMLPGSVHVLAHFEGRLVSHAGWVTRWLQPAGNPLLRTAYVEAVATDPAYQRRGFAAAVMRKLQSMILDFDLGGLSPFDERYYARLGWELWRGPLAIRTPDGLTPSPADEQVMILRLPRTPELNLDGRLTAEWRAGELW